MIDFSVLYNKRGVPSIMPFVESVDLIDVMSGRASSLSITLCNADGRFTGKWSATKGDSISLRMPPAGDVSFAISKIGIQERPRLVTWVAEARPSVSRQQKDHGAGDPPPSTGALVRDKKSWDDGPLRSISLKVIAERVCKECGLSLRYFVKENPVIQHCARYNETGYHLLTRLCRRYGLALRASAGALSIINEVHSDIKERPSTISIQLSDVISLSKVDAVKPSRVVSSRLDPRSAKDVTFKAGDGDGLENFFEYDIERPSSIYSATVMDGLLGELSIIPKPGVVAGSVINIGGFDLREVIEMRYNRTGDTESMALKTRAI